MISPLVSLLAFLLLHFITGLLLPLYAGAAPPLFALSRGAAGWLDGRLNRKSRKKRTLALRGAVVALAFLGAAVALGRVLRQADAEPYSWMIEIAVLFLCVDLMQPLNVLRAVARDLREKRPGGAETLLRTRVPLPDKPDAHTLARRAVEWSALTLDTWFTGPLFWYALGGTRGAVLYAVVAGLCAATATEDDRHRYFGLTARWILAVLNAVPAAITTVLIALAAVFVSKANPLRALTTAAKNGITTWPAAAMSGALGVTLGGPPHGWTGPKGSSARLTPEDVERCALLYFVFFLCVMALSSAAILFTHFFHILK